MLTLWCPEDITLHNIFPGKLVAVHSMTKLAKPGRVPTFSTPGQGTVCNPHTKCFPLRVLAVHIDILLSLLFNIKEHSVSF
jgi:hypothetical protein